MVRGRCWRSKRGKGGVVVVVVDKEEAHLSTHQRRGEWSSLCMLDHGASCTTEVLVLVTVPPQIACFEIYFSPTNQLWPTPTNLTYTPRRR